MTFVDGVKEYAGQEFKNLQLAGAGLDALVFESCTFVKGSFHDAVFQACQFRKCTFRKCDLALVHFKDCVFADTSFEDCQLVGVNWTEAAWSKSLLHQPFSFTDCALNHSVFTGLKLRGLKLTQCLARDVDFSECDLSRANCVETDFAEARFSHTNLSEADFTGATNYAISATLNTFKKTKFSLPEAISLLHNLDIILTEG